MKYRPEIDGLRSIAIIPVLLYHLNSSFLPYGYLGVDIFFVISGFLISSVISHKLSTNNFSVLEFYERRIKRIAPLYFLIIFFSLPIAYFLLLPHQLTDFSQSIIASLLFISNFFFYAEMDYFNPFINYSPLVHTWSLSVEEQFYLFLPALMILLHKLNKKIQVFVYSILAFLSLYYCLNLSQTDISLSFYSSFTRAWELLIGVILSFLVIKEVPKRQKIIVDFICLFSIIFLLAIFFGLIKFNHPGPFTIVPIILTCIIIIFSNKSMILKKLLRIPILVHIGLLSYSLYMIHQPVLSFYKIWKESINVVFENNLIEVLLLIIFIYLLSFLSYKFYEKPIRYVSVSRKKVFFFFFFFSCIFSAIGYYGHTSRGLKNNFINKYSDIIKFDRDEIIKERYNYTAKNIDTLSNSKNKILVIGDSMGDDLFDALSIIKKDYDFDVKKLKIDDTCLDELIKNLSLNTDVTLDCDNLSTKNIKELIENSQTIILSSLWTQITYNDGINLANFISSNIGKKVFIVGPAQFSDIFTISIDLSKKNIETPNINNYIFDKHIRLDKFNVNNLMLEKFDNSYFYINKFDFFCNQNSCDLFFDDGYPLIWDDAHLSSRGLKLYGDFIIQKINNSSKIIN